MTVQLNQASAKTNERVEKNELETLRNDQGLPLFVSTESLSFNQMTFLYPPASSNNALLGSGVNTSDFTAGLPDIVVPITPQSAHNASVNITSHAASPILDIGYPHIPVSTSLHSAYLLMVAHHW